MKEAPELPGQPPVPETTGLFAIDPDTGMLQSADSRRGAALKTRLSWHRDEGVRGISS